MGGGAKSPSPSLCVVAVSNHLINKLAKKVIELVSFDSQGNFSCIVARYMLKRQA